MPRKIAIVWTAVVLGIAVLNILDVLPDWTTVAAVLTLPLVSAASGGCKAFGFRN